MRVRTVPGFVGLVLAGVALAGCQSSDSGSGSRLLSRQSNDAFARPPMNSASSTVPGTKSLAISDTNSRPGMMPGTNSVQQAGSVQNAASSSAALPVSNNSSGFNQTGAVVSRPMGDSNMTMPSGPTPPPPPGGYTIPAPTNYTPPANSSVPTRKPGDDQ
jgi:hypothetical protein